MHPRFQTTSLYRQVSHPGPTWRNSRLRRSNLQKRRSRKSQRHQEKLLILSLQPSVKQIPRPCPPLENARNWNIEEEIMRVPEAC